MKISTTYLTIVYWLSDLFLALWLGALALAFQTMDSVAPDALLVMLGALGKVLLVVALVLVASAVLEVVLGYRDRSSFGWWLVWSLRTIAIIALTGFAIWAASKVDSERGRLEEVVAVEAASREITVPSATPPPLGDSAAAASTTVPDTAVGSDRAMPPAASGNDPVVVAGAELVAAYSFWAPIQFALGAIIFLAGAVKQAAWRQSWADARKAHDPDVLAEDAPADAVGDKDDGPAESEGEGEGDASSGSEPDPPGEKAS